MARRLVPLTALLICSACLSIAGLDGYGPAASMGGGGSGGTGGEGVPTGGEGGTEMDCPPDPSGWLGPVAVYRGDGGSSDPPDCGVDGWSLDADGGIDPMPGACSCACDLVPPPQQAAFCSVAWTVQWSSSNDCASAVEATMSPVATNQCTASNPPTEQIKSAEVTPSGPPGMGICTSPLPDLGPTRFETAFRICSFDAAPDDPVFCSRQVPQGYPTRLCVYKPSAMAGDCPTGYPEREVIVTDVTDASTCSCNCTQGEVACRGQLNLYGAPGCGGGLPQNVPADTMCHDVPVPDTFDSLEVVFVQAEGQCGMMPPSFMPDITENAYATVCCEP